MKFTLQHKASGSKARAGEIQTDHGTILTPIFMPVGTAAAMKGIFHRDLKQEAHAQIILALPPLPSSRYEDFGGGGRCTQVLDLGGTDAYR